MLVSSSVQRKRNRKMNEVNAYIPPFFYKKRIFRKDKNGDLSLGHQKYMKPEKVKTGGK